MLLRLVLMKFTENLFYIVYVIVELCDLEDQPVGISKRFAFDLDERARGKIAARYHHEERNWLRETVSFNEQSKFYCVH